MSDRRATHRLGKANGHDTPAPRAQQGRADVRRRRHEGDRPLGIAADEPADPARAANFDRNGHARRPRAGHAARRCRGTGSPAAASRLRRSRTPSPRGRRSRAAKRPQGLFASRRSRRLARPGEPRRGKPAATRATTTCRRPTRATRLFQYVYAQKKMASPAAGRGVPRELSRPEIDEFLREQRIARLGCHAEGVTYVVPLIYAYEDGAVVAVTTEGRKTAMLRENPRVCVEIDEYDKDGRGSWRSVIAHGTCSRTVGRRDRARARPLARALRGAAGRTARPRPLGENVVVLRIVLEEISGRAVER